MRFLPCNLQSRCFVFFAQTTGVCGFIIAKNPGQKVCLNGANFWAILGFSGLEREPISFIEVVEDPYLADNPN